MTPFAFGVKYMHHGHQQKFITLDEERAYAYATEWHGTVIPLFAPEPVQMKFVDETTSQHHSPPV